MHLLSLLLAGLKMLSKTLTFLTVHLGSPRSHGVALSFCANHTVSVFTLSCPIRSLPQKEKWICIERFCAFLSHYAYSHSVSVQGNGICGLLILIVHRICGQRREENGWEKERAREKEGDWWREKGNVMSETLKHGWDHTNTLTIIINDMGKKISMCNSMEIYKSLYLSLLCLSVCLSATLLCLQCHMILSKSF